MRPFAAQRRELAAGEGADGLRKIEPGPGQVFGMAARVPVEKQRCKADQAEQQQDFDGTQHLFARRLTGC
jgi:hypothetical protein